MKRHHLHYLLAIGGGAVTWALVAPMGGRREAWDSPLYFTVAIPLTCGLSSSPDTSSLRAWRPAHHDAA